MRLYLRRSIALIALACSLISLSFVVSASSAEANGSGIPVEIVTSVDNETVSIGLGGYVNIFIAWGDGQVDGPLTSATDRVLQHTYDFPGTYNAYISGTSLSHFGDCSIQTFDYTMRKVTSWGAFNITDLSCAFAWRYNISEVPNTLPSGVTTLARAFQNTQFFNQNLNGWLTSNVTDMSDTFSMTGTFNNGGEPLRWDTSSVTNMNKMFHYAGAFNADVSTFDTSSVTDMQYMFAAARSFNQSLAAWDVRNVEYMTGMFYADQANSEFVYSLSDTNYSNTLIGWAAQRNLRTAVPLDAPANQATGCDAVAARSVLTSLPNNWVITDIAPTDVVPVGGCSQPSPHSPALARTGSESQWLSFVACTLLMLGGLFAIGRRVTRPKQLPGDEV